jgi:PAP2 superfamily
LDLLWQIALFAMAYYGYRITRGWIDDPQGAAVAFENARHLIGIERTLGIFVEPSVNAWADTKPAIIDFASWMYINAQTSVTLGALSFLYLFHNRSFYFVRNMFLVAFGLALVGYVLLPTAPPRFFPEWGFQDAVSDFVGVNHDSVTANALFNPYAAVPSMHIAFALMVGVPLARLCKHRAARIAWSVYPLLVLFVIVATGNHFFTDAFLGGCTAAVSAYAASWLARARPAAWAFSHSGVPA